MPLTIEATAEHHFEGLYQVFDAVAREGRYLAFLQAPPKPACLAYYREVVAQDRCHFVAVEDDVIGWCDILPVVGDTRTHVGQLGMGLVAEARGRGIGTQLLEAAIAKAWSQGLARIQLAVRADNRPAIALYQRFGFVIEGCFRRDILVGGEYFDGYGMALLRD
jgi:putative acetyltransferase